MKVSNFQIRVFHALEEAIQPSQLDSISADVNDAFKGTYRDPENAREAILSTIAKVDPTVRNDDPINTSKYGTWLLSAVKKAVRTRRDIDWSDANPERARAKGVYNFIPGFETQTPAENAWEYKSKLVSVIRDQMWLLWDPERVDRLRKAFENLELLKKSGQAPEAQLDLDINKYKSPVEFFTNFSKLDPSLLLSKRKVKRGKLAPFAVPGSTLVYEQPDALQVYKITTPEASAFHSAKTKWCIKSTDMAQSYIGAGPLYVAYFHAETPYMTTLKPAGGRLATVESGVEEGAWFRAIAISFTSHYNPALTRQSAPIMFEIRDTSNTWVPSGWSKETGFDTVLEALFNLAKSEVGEGKKFASGFQSYIEDDEDEEDEVDEDAIPDYVQDVIDEYGLRVDNDGDIRLTFSTNDPRDVSNFEQLHHNLAGSDNTNPLVLYASTRGGTAPEESVWDEISTHLSGESLDDTREYEIENEYITAAWKDSDGKDFQTFLKEVLFPFAANESRIEVPDAKVEYDSDGEPENVETQGVTLRGIPWDQWSAAISKFFEEYTGGVSEFLSDANISVRWEPQEGVAFDAYPSVADALKKYFSEPGEFQWFSKRLGLKSEWDPVDGQGTLPFALNSTQYNAIQKHLERTYPVHSSGDSEASTVSPEEAAATKTKLIDQIVASASVTSSLMNAQINTQVATEFVDNYVDVVRAPSGKLEIVLKPYQEPQRQATESSRNILRRVLLGRK